MPDDDQDPARTGPDGHAHDDAHDDDDGPAPEEVEHARQALARLRGALAGLDDESLRRGVETMRERSRAEVAQALNLSRAAIHLGEALAPLVRRKLAAAPPDRQLAVAFALTEAANDATVDALGDRHADPSREDLEAVLPGIIEAHGLPTVRLMVAAYAASDAPVQPVMRALLDTDERFALPDEPPPLAAAEGGLELRRRTPEEEAAQAAKREQRRAAKEAKRAAERKRREAAAAGQAARRAQRQRARRGGS
ncbi:MAG: hypothetical protein KatS3mg009_1201 [Acidimicrobiia bacterium]|nr:MAG: hypothetical protein KatS3mg009_1201 [Acidimicrobiia bacterium]